ncbi:DUF475 domain-containing protein [Candidatus Saccharibacteria bacterium]|nr:DUF475 domain-containing protein [Candidatus Saccharibacteria bacterium]
MKKLLHKDHIFRIFFISAIITVISLLFVKIQMGSAALFTTLVLILVEIMFSFDNAIINARVLAGMSRFWQQMFLTVGMLIAVFGMRLIFPIILVTLTTGMSIPGVINIALHHPAKYAEAVTAAHPYIASFGGMFLLMLAFSFFFDPGRKVLWISLLERPLQRMGKWWIYTGISVAILGLIVCLPANHHPMETLVAGLIGVVLQLLLGKFNDSFTVTSAKKANSALAGFMAFMYLQVLDASFSFDGVIGAFAITNNIFYITLGLGIGALWVRSLTIMMVRRKTLQTYRYLEHGAHYTIALLAAVLLLGLFVQVPEAIAGITGLVIVGAAIASSAISIKLHR